ncbi:CD48 antigen-like [Chanodichthys erythropterus]|uniref:CD48 antigen-like n=1 Tax=Chanodichthys erythropterus TaxID=933992 RepID=UPI00351E4FBC
MFHTVLFCLCLWRLVGVFGDSDAVKSVSVKEGDSVTLNTDLTEIQTDDLILWTFGSKGPLIAVTNGKTSKIYDVLDGRFRDRLKLDHQTGSLTITNIRSEHDGDYKVEISGSTKPDIRFSVSVFSPPSGPPVSVSLIMVLISATAAGSLLIVAVIGMCRKLGDADQTYEDETDSPLYKQMTESEMTEVIYTCFTTEK